MPPTLLTPGDIAITGYITNGTPDSFSFVNLVPLEAGTILYFTDNGWTGTGFRGVTATDADGNENLIKFTVNTNIAAGTIISSVDVTNPNFTWTKTGSVASPASGTYADLSLSQSGEQIAAVQSTGSSPLLSGVTAIAQIDNTGTFENATASTEGNVIPGLSQSSNTAVLFNNLSTYAAFNLNTLTSGTRENWLAAINNASNWTFSNLTTLPAGSITVSTAPPANTAPTISPISALSGVVADPTNPGVSFTVSDAETNPDALVVTATSSSNPGVAAIANVTITTGTAGQRIVTVNPTGVGFADLTLTVTDGGGLQTSTTLNYAASAASVTPTTSRFYTGASDASTAIALDTNYMLVADDEDQVLRLYDRNDSGSAINGFDFTSALGLTDLSNGQPREVDIEASVRVGDRLYWLGSHSNSSSGSSRPNRYRLFATDLSGSGASTTLSYAGRYDNLRTDLIGWGDANGFDFTSSAAIGNLPEDPQLDGFNIEGLAIAPDGTTAYIGFRAPNVPTTGRTQALIAPITNFADLVTGAATTAVIGAPIELDLGGRGIREIKRNASGQYLIVAGPADNATGTAPKDFRLYTWTGNPADAPELRSTDLTALNTGGSFESIVDLPDVLTDSSPIQLLVDNGDTDWYGNGQASKDLAQIDFQKFRSDVVTLGAVVTTLLPAIEISAVDATAAEAGSDPGTFRITRTGSTAADLTVTYAIATGAGQATNGTDYTPTLTGTVAIAAGSSFVDLTLTPTDDAIVEGSETVSLTLVDDATYDLGSTTSATVTIADNDIPSGATPTVGDIIFNEYVSDNDANNNDFFELLVLKDNLDLRGLRVSDNELLSGALNINESVFTFGNDAFLSSVPKGTTIAVWTTNAGITPDTTASAATGDWKLVLAPGTGVTAGTDGLGGTLNTGLSTSGEALYLYLPGADGTSAGTDNVYLDFISYEADGGDAPTGLVDLNLPSVADNAYFTGNTAAGNDLPANWTQYDFPPTAANPTPGEANPGQDLSPLRFLPPTPGFTLIESGGSTDVNELGETTDTYTIALKTLPRGAVSVAIAADGQTQISADGVNFFSSVIVNLSDTTAQTITVRAVNDTLMEGSPHTGVITHSITSSSDPAYSNSLTPIPNLNVNITDNDVSLTPIYTIQGSGTASPLVNTTVTLQGIVTGDFQAANQLGGFYLQDATGDGNSLTSDGIFVSFTGTDVGVGQLVQITGTVAETFGQTQINGVGAAGVSILGSGAIAPLTLDLPVTAAGDLESYEGMLVTFPETLTVTENFNLGRFGEVLLSSEGRLINPTNFVDPNDSPASGTNSTGNSNVAAVTAAQTANSLREILLDDGSNVQNPTTLSYVSADNTLRSGDTTSNLTGVLGYGFSSYRIQPTVAPVFNPTNARTAAPDPVGGNVKVASFNVLNYFNGDGLGGGFPTARGATTAQEYERQSAKIVSAIAALDADVVGLIEMENDGDGVNSAIADLVNRLNTFLGAPIYDYIRDPATGVGTDAIKVAFIYKPGNVTPVGSALSSTDPIFDRLPVAQTFSLNSNGATFTPVINHFKSKSGPPTDPTDPNADQGDGQGAWNLKRTQQAQALLGFINTVQATSTDSDVLVIGDLNAYGEEDPIDVLRSGGLVDSLGQFVPDPYSFVFDGQSGRLDQALTTDSLSTQVTGVTEWHINADEPRVLDYNLEFKGPGLSPDLYAPTPYRSSDHDPVLVGLNLTPTLLAPTDLSLSSSSVDENVPASTVVGTFSSADPNPGSSFIYTLVSGTGDADNGVFGIVGDQLNIAVSPNFEAKSSYTIRVRTTDQTGLFYEEAVAIAINNLNEAPTAVNDSYSVVEDSVLTISAPGLLANDSDVDGNPLLVSGSSQAANGAIAINGNGAFTYTPNANFSGADSFTYTISDGQGGTATAAVNLTVTPFVNIIKGTSRADDLRGTDRDDIIKGLEGNDRIRGFGGNDRLEGGIGNDSLDGGTGNDYLDGDTGNDSLIGGFGEDVLVGGGGSDNLNGGSGRDRFVYTSHYQGGDTIRDFVGGINGEALDLQALFDNLGYTGSDPFADRYIKLVRQGSTTKVQIDADGIGNSTGFNTLTTLVGITPANLIIGTNLLV